MKEKKKRGVISCMGSLMSISRGDHSNVGWATPGPQFSLTVKCRGPIRCSLRAVPWLSGKAGAMVIILKSEQEWTEM